MAQNSKIEWTHHTLNLWHGCTKVHEGCDNCYAEKLAHRWGNDIWGVDKPRKEIKKAFDDLDKFQKLAAQNGEVHRVFVGSMMDIFEKPMPLINSKGETLSYTTEALRAMLFQRIHTNQYPNLQFLLLTKRPSNIKKYIPATWLTNPPANVMFGTSVSNNKTYADLVPHLLRLNVKTFLSVEPQICIVTGRSFCPSCDRLLNASLSKMCGTCHSETIQPNWIIQGGESGHGKRPFRIFWALMMRKDCKKHNIPYFFKQIDKVQPIPDELLIREFPKI